MNHSERLRRWEAVVSDGNWDGCRDARFMAREYGDDELEAAEGLCGQDYDSEDYDDGR